MLYLRKSYQQNFTFGKCIRAFQKSLVFFYALQKTRNKYEK